MKNPELMLQFCKAMADESRLKIIGLLSAAERSVQQLAGLLDLKEPTVSHHLAILKALGLVTLRADGNTHWYALDDGALRTISRTVFSRESIALLAVTADSEAWERKVLASFLDGGRLIEIPVSQKKRWAVLKWLADKFAQDTDFSEAQVNALLKRHHPDCATLRRELVGWGMLTRESGVYRRGSVAPGRGFDARPQ
jgi:hypothetical protein